MESRFAATLNGLLQQNLPIGDIAHQLLSNPALRMPSTYLLKSSG
jgi:hypothetical protein